MVENPLPGPSVVVVNFELGGAFLLVDEDLEAD